MENKTNNHLFEEHLKKIKHRIDYRINESVRYTPISSIDEFDEIPKTDEAGEQEDASKLQSKTPVEPSNDQPISADTPIPAFDKAPEGGEQPDLNTDSTPMGAEPQQQVDDIQNDIIKHNIEAMKGIHGQLESLNGIVQSLNTKIEALNADVDEVREPTSSEKLMSKKDVSYPYYFNLNDFWKGNWFNEKHNENSNGVKELPDGTYIADFDDLPQKSKIDVQNSFNDIA
ncbi:hypothetical protein M0Q97_10090 [Candidatus Dojkabacteria bacterium]|jgi:hypothetical protein|nr:hypothetical protein [Candidatus Dojkabacteria bacterium]